MGYGAATLDEAAFNDWADRVPGPHKAEMAALEVAQMITVPVARLRMGLSELAAPPPQRPSIMGPSDQDLSMYRASLEQQSTGMRNYWTADSAAPSSAQRPMSGAAVSPRQGQAFDAVATTFGDALGSVADSLAGTPRATPPEVAPGMINTRSLKYAWEAANHLPAGANGGAGGPTTHPADPRSTPRNTLS